MTAPNPTAQTVFLTAEPNHLGRTVHLVERHHNGADPVDVTMCGSPWDATDAPIVDADRLDRLPITVHGVCLSTAHDRALAVTGEHGAAQTVRSLLERWAHIERDGPPVADRRRVRIVIEADVELSVIERGFRRPGPSTLDQIDELIVRTVGEIDGVSNVRSGDVSLRDPARGGGR